MLFFCPKAKNHRWNIKKADSRQDRIICPVLFERKVNMDIDASVSSNVIINKDCLAALKDMPDKSVDCCVTSPPYYGLRDYGMEGQIGREKTPEQYVERLTEVFAQLYRVLSDSGTFWLNISDSYCGTGSRGACLDPKNPKGRNGQKVSLAQNARGAKARI